MATLSAPVAMIRTFRHGPVAQEFLVRDSSNGQMCLACHDPNRTIQGQVNPLGGLERQHPSSRHQQGFTEAHVGSYRNRRQNSCTSCHMEHNANGPARSVAPGHPASRTSMSPPRIASPATMAEPTCRPGAQHHGRDQQDRSSDSRGKQPHDAAEPGVLMNNRHATCVDCHSAHGPTR